MVEHGNHADLHLLAPAGAGGQIVIGDPRGPEPGTLRRLIADLALLPVEGGARVAIVRDAQAMNDVSQSALLKTLEEPPDNTTIILCADDDEQLLPTIRSRCARVRLGTVDARSIEYLLAQRGLADPPTAARLARLTAGRPGLAVAYAGAPGADAVRSEIVRQLLDLLGARPATRLTASKDLQARAMDLVRLLDAAPRAIPLSGTSRPSGTAPAAAGSGRAKITTKAANTMAADPVLAGDAAEDEAADNDSAPSGKVSAAQRRQAVRTLLELWRDLTRDLVLVERRAPQSVRDVALLDELEAAARSIPPGAAAAHLASLLRAGELLDGNVTPELVLDTLLLRWPRRRRAA